MQLIQTLFLTFPVAGRVEGILKPGDLKSNLRDLSHLEGKSPAATTWRYALEP